MIRVVCLLEILINNLRVVYWNDANGSTFVMAKIGNDWFEDHDIVVEDCTVWIIVVHCPQIGQSWRQTVETDMFRLCMPDGCYRQRHQEVFLPIS